MSPVDNLSLPMKIEIRKNAIELIGGIEKCNVLDMFCGKDGMMYKHTWKGASRYFGIDKTPHKMAPTMAGDTYRVLPKINMDNYNIYDIDTYSSPWRAARHVLKKRTLKDSFYLVLTSGEFRGINQKHTNSFVRLATGTKDMEYTGFLRHYHREVLLWCIRKLINDAKQHKCKIFIFKAEGHIHFLKMHYVLLYFYE